MFYNKMAALESIKETLLYSGPLSKVYKITTTDQEKIKKFVYDEKLFLRELKILKKISEPPNNHPNIPRLYEFSTEPIEIFNEKKQANVNSYILVQEFIDGFDLKKYYTEFSWNLNKNTIVLLIKQILEAFIFLHNNGIYHRDIKPANLMITSDNIIKVIDFGLSCISDNEEKDEAFCTPGLKGTPMYIAPELFSNKDNITLDNWRTAEIYSVGCVLYYLLHGFAPYEKTVKDLKNLVKIVKENQPVPYIKSKYTDIDNIIKKLLIKEPSERSSLEEALLEITKIDLNFQDNSYEYEDYEDYD